MGEPTGFKDKARQAPPRRPVNERVREQARLVIAPGTIETIGTRFNEAGSAILEAVRTQSIEHAPMMTFIAVATILLLGMMRT